MSAIKSNKKLVQAQLKTEIKGIHRVNENLTKKIFGQDSTQLTGGYSTTEAANSNNGNDNKITLTYMGRNDKMFNQARKTYDQASISGGNEQKARGQIETIKDVHQKEIKQPEYV